MFLRRFWSVVGLILIWLFLRNHTFVEKVKTTVTEHPEWSEVEHHSTGLKKSLKHVARDSVIKFLDE